MTLAGVDFKGLAYLTVIAGAGIAGLVLWKNSAQIKAAASSAVAAVNPADSRNVVNQAANKGLQAATGLEDVTWGTFIWSKVNPGLAATMENITSSRADPVTGNAAKAVEQLSKPAESNFGDYELQQISPFMFGA